VAALGISIRATHAMIPGWSVLPETATEEDPETFDRLVRELNDLLEQKHERIHPDHKPN
jgi:hypothetical protein